MTERWHDEDAARDFALENPAEEICYERGHGWVSVDGELWFRRDSRDGNMILLMTWLTWVAYGCRVTRVTRVTRVDRERGIITTESG